MNSAECLKPYSAGLTDRQKRAKNCQLKRIYGVTLEWYDAKFLEQGGVCGCCGRPPKKLALAVDHNHRTGKVRGLLCMMCNRKIIGIIERLRVCPSWILNYLQLTDPENPLNRGEGWQTDIGQPPRRKRKK